MVAFTKYSRYRYPVQFVICPKQIKEIPQTGPFNITVCTQVSESIKDSLQSHAVRVSPRYTLITDLHQPLDDIWQAINSSRRSHIRRAMRMDIDVQQNSNDDDLYRHTVHSYRRKGLEGPSRSHFDRILQYSDRFHINVDGNMAMTSVYLKLPHERIIMMYNSFDTDLGVPNSLRSALTSYLHWWLIQYYKEQGYHEYDWGGIVLDEHDSAFGVTRFKMTFGGEMHTEWDMLLLGRCLRPFASIIDRTRHRPTSQIEDVA